MWMGRDWMDRRELGFVLIKERTKENRLSTGKEERDSSFSLLMDR